MSPLRPDRQVLETIVFVKADHVTANHVRDLRGLTEREKAAIGVLISMEDPTKPMQTEAVTGRVHKSPMWNRKYPGDPVPDDCGAPFREADRHAPVRQVGATFRRAPKASGKGHEAGHLLL